MEARDRAGGGAGGGGALAPRLFLAVDVRTLNVQLACVAGGIVWVRD